MLLKSSESCKSEPHTGCHVRVNMFSNHALPSIPGVLVCRLANRMCRRQPCRSPLAKYKCSSSSSIINIQHSRSTVTKRSNVLFPVFSLHKEMAITDTAAAPEPILSSFNSRKAHVLVIITKISILM